MFMLYCRCAVGSTTISYDVTNNNDIQLLNISIPHDDETDTWSQCQKYDIQDDGNGSYYRTNSTEPRICNAWVYDKQTIKSSFASEVKLHVVFFSVEILYAWAIFKTSLKVK